MITPVSFLYSFALIFITQAALAFPGLKEKAEFLPVLHALITDAREVEVAGELYGIQFTKSSEGIENTNEVPTFFLGDKTEPTLSAQELSTALSLLAHAFKPVTTNAASGCPFMRGEMKSNDTGSKDLEHFITMVKVMMLNHGLHEEANRENLKNLITLEKFDFIERVSKGKVRQRYRLKLYNPETLSYKSFDFYLRMQEKPVLKIVTKSRSTKKKKKK